MRTVRELLEMECGAMLAEISKTLGRELLIGEELEIAMLSGAYKVGSSITYHDLVHEPHDVTFPEYLKAAGYPLVDEELNESRAQREDC